MVDESACYLAAQDLQRYVGDSSSADKTLDPVAAALFKLFFVSICHQINWDFLLGRMREYFFAADTDTMIGRALKYGAKDVEHMLAGYARPDRIKAKERAKIMRMLAAALVEQYGSRVDGLFFPSRIGGDDGLIERLNKFSAFSEDPVGKKVNVFVQELLREHIATFDDEGSVQPAIDYHLIRLYLRSGRVTSKEVVVLSVLTSASPTRMRLITLLRQKVGEALALTSFYAKKTIFEVNYVEWQIARQRCELDGPICTGPWPNSEFDQAIIAIQPLSCPYSGWCLAHNDSEWTALREPEVRKAFY